MSFRRRLKMLIEYEGTRYAGWERQKSGLAIQEVLEEAVLRITRERVTLEGSGRTDAGVHALAQVASFSLQRDVDLRKLVRGLNAVTPPDIGILSVEEAPPDFHARKSAKSKRYRYTILNSPAPRPLSRHMTYHVPTPLDMASMARAARLFAGTHDFTAFAREAHLRRSCVRTLLAVETINRVPFVDLEFHGTGFLYNMVRIIVGTLIEVGAGKRPAEDIPRLLEGGPRRLAGYTAPAHGLVLVEVCY